MSRRLKILISAYACSPVRGSEPGMGWGFVQALSRYHDLWVITEQEKFKDEIENEYNKDSYMQEHVTFFYIAKKRHRKLRKIWPPSYYWFYRSWHKKAFALAQELHKSVQFDIVHQLNMVGFREPGYLWKMDVPFVWGPIGGLNILPWQFLYKLGMYGFLYHLCKNFINSIHMSFLLRPKLAAAKASVIIAATPDTQVAIAKLWKRKSIVVCEVGPPLNLEAIGPVSRNVGEPLKLVWSGTHTPGKSLNLLLEALSLLDENIDWFLDVLGDGPRCKAWKKFVYKFGITSRCTFHGWLPRNKSMEVMRFGHLFFVTSLSDLTSTVIIEAISLGLPVICLNHCGFAHVITENCGIKIPVTNPRDVVLGIVNAINRISANNDYHKRLSMGAIERSKRFSWQEKAELINCKYSNIVKDAKEF